MVISVQKFFLMQVVASQCLGYELACGSMPSTESSHQTVTLARLLPVAVYLEDWAMDHECKSFNQVASAASVDLVAKEPAATAGAMDDPFQYLPETWSDLPAKYAVVFSRLVWLGAPKDG